MREQNPDLDSLNVEWVRKVFSQVSLDLDQSTAAPLPQSINAAVRSAITSIVGGPLADMRKTLGNNTVAEVHSWQLKLNQRDKDRQF